MPCPKKSKRLRKIFNCCSSRQNVSDDEEANVCTEKVEAEAVLVVAEIQSPTPIDVTLNDEENINQDTNALIKEDPRDCEILVKLQDDSDDENLPKPKEIVISEVEVSIEPVKSEENEQNFYNEILKEIQESVDKDTTSPLKVTRRNSMPNVLDVEDLEKSVRFAKSSGSNTDENSQNTHKFRNTPKKGARSTDVDNNYENINSDIVDYVTELIENACACVMVNKSISCGITDANQNGNDNGCMEYADIGDVGVNVLEAKKMEYFIDAVRDSYLDDEDFEIIELEPKNCKTSLKEKFTSDEEDEYIGDLIDHLIDGAVVSVASSKEEISDVSPATSLTEQLSSPMRNYYQTVSGSNMIWGRQPLLSNMPLSHDETTLPSGFKHSPQPVPSCATDSGVGQSSDDEKTIVSTDSVRKIESDMSLEWDNYIPGDDALDSPRIFEDSKDPDTLAL